MNFIRSTAAYSLVCYLLQARPGPAVSPVATVQRAALRGCNRATRHVACR